MSNKIIKKLEDVAKARGGKLLSEKYINHNTKLEWQCKNGHVWWAAPSHIKRGTWCPECAIKKRADIRKLTIEEMQEIAKSRGGKCLSTAYIDNKTKLEWECKDGHTWWAVPSSVKQGCWCPFCGWKMKKENIKK